MSRLLDDVPHRLRRRFARAAVLRFLLIFLAIWSVINAYVLWRAAGVPLVRNHVPRLAIVLIGVFLASSYVAARIIESRAAWQIGGVLEWIGAQWMGVLRARRCACGVSERDSAGRAASSRIGEARERMNG